MELKSIDEVESFAEVLKDLEELKLDAYGSEEYMFNATAFEEANDLGKKKSVRKFIASDEFRDMSYRVNDDVMVRFDQKETGGEVIRLSKDMFTMYVIWSMKGFAVNIYKAISDIWM